VFKKPAKNLKGKPAKSMIKIGTRSSKLALWQTHFVANLLEKNGLSTKIITMETKGDKILHAPFAEIGTKGLFTEELEEKLKSGEIDIAIHSAKDMQSELPKELEIIAFTKRESPQDVLISFDPTFSLEKPGIKIVGTSSTRRRAILKHYYPEVELKDARGNLQTRFKKLEEGQYEAMILAYAGVHRMELDQFIVQHLPLHIFTPPVGQGSIAIEASKSLDNEKKKIIRQLANDNETEVCLKAERAYLKKLEGGCSIPSFGLARIKENRLEITGGIISLDGAEIVREKVHGAIPEPEKAGLLMAEMVLNSGGDKILEEIKRKNKV
jgi:hydroxymethylbilane synthase